MQNIRKRKILFFIFFPVIIISGFFAFHTFTYSKYKSKENRTILLNISQPVYTVVFHSNNGENEEKTQDFVYGVSQNLSINTYTNENYEFSGWNTDIDGNGHNYDDQESVKNLTSENHGIVNLYAQWASGVASVNGTVYDTLQAALNAVLNDNTKTTVKLLKNTSEIITVNKNRDIILDLGGHTVSNNGNGAVIDNFATSLEIINGTITSSNTSDGVINNESNATLIINGARVIMTASGGKQAIYNNKGTVVIEGDSYLSSASNQRSTVQNLAGGTLTITGGEIIATGNQSAVNNAGDMVIGEEGGEVSTQSPYIRGNDYGITSSKTFAFYDGITEGLNAAINNENNVNLKETGYTIAHSGETVDSKKYDTAFLALDTSTVTFRSEFGNKTRVVATNQEIGYLPVITGNNAIFDGWFTAETGGEQITEETIITADTIFYAHYTKTTVCKIGNTEYDSVKKAIDAVTANNEEVTITLTKDINEKITIPRNKNIVLDLQNYNITNPSNNALISNDGTLKITNGTVSSSVDYATINNNSSGHLTIDGARIISEGTRSAIFNTGGTVIIDGNAYLSSTATGTPSGTNMQRGTINNDASGTIIIKDGTIIGVNQQAVSNIGTLTVGIKDGDISSTPVIIGKNYGIRSTNVFNYYDGVIKGMTDSINGSITDTEDGSQLISGTEDIDGDTYVTAHLE